MDESLSKVVSTLERLADTSYVWPDGLLNPGGPHRRLKGFHYPISIGDDECGVFGKLVERFQPEQCYIIGNAFGYSSAYIAHVMQQHGGQRVVTLDNQSEGAGQVAAGIAQQLTEELGLTGILDNKKGTSPQDIASTVETDAYDLVFIDGLHRHPQVTHDLEGVLPFLADDAILVFHDSWIIGVPEAVERAKQEGFRGLWIPTSCEMIVTTKSPERWAQLEQLFPDGVEDKGARNYLYGWTLYVRETVAYHVKRLFGRE